MNGASANHGVPAEGLLAAARGFLFLAWGPALGLLMLSGAIQFRALEGLPFPPQVPGCLLALAGVGWLRRADTGALRAPAFLWIPALLCLYFAPLVLWWRGVPYSGYLLLNAVGAAASVLALLAGICREAARAGRVLGAASFAREARWAVVLCGPLSGALLAALTLWTAVRAGLAGTSLYGEWFDVLFHLPRGAAVMAVFPFTVSMACAWRARAVCLDALRAGGATPSA